MKEFNLEQAKAGKPVCRRDGKKARIICYDAKSGCPIIALVEYENGEEGICTYHINGYFFSGKEDERDLMMAPKKHEGWVNIYNENGKLHTGMAIWETEQKARDYKGIDGSHYIATIKIEWEE